MMDYQRRCPEEETQFISSCDHHVAICVSLPLPEHNYVYNDIPRDHHVNPHNFRNNNKETSMLPTKISNHANQLSNEKPKVMLSHLPRRPPIDIEFKSITYSIPGNKPQDCRNLLKDLKGKFKSGTLTAIMGPSGAGKSTLMNVLAGYKTSNMNGTVIVNNKERDMRTFRKMSCYIMQDDCLLPYMTVHEAMTVSANLKLGKDMSDAAKETVIQGIIETLGLKDTCNTKVHNLSGGQRKRLSIALELVNNPPVMFFDEPTSGLDSSSSFQCLTLLKFLSRGGRTIICTIHQPSARLFEMFDHLYVLAEGQCIYQGKVEELVPFLSFMDLKCPSYHNPADYVVEVASGEHGNCVQKLVNAVNKGQCNPCNQSVRSNEKGSTKQNAAITRKTPLSSETFTFTPENSTVLNLSIHQMADDISCNVSLLDEPKDTIIVNEEQEIGFPTNSLRQTFILLKRAYLSQIRDMTLTRIRLISHVVVGFLIGIIYYQIGNDAAKATSNAGCIFFTVLFIMFTALMPTILTFPTEMAVFAREHLNHWYTLTAYYFARTMTDIPFQIVYTIAYVMIVYFMSGQPMEIGRFFMFLNICILTSLVAQSIGLLIGAAMDIETGVFIGPVLSVPAVLFSGFFVNFNALPPYLSWLTYVSYMRYSFEGAMISIYGQNRQRLECSEDFCVYRSPKKFLMDMSMDKAVYWHNALALVITLLGLRIAAYFALRLKLRLLR
ncbi:hypothetical protein QAD02_004460 [Eretmocerus hayati]|uniref:Uncharacterized protein n=1 Tax=Eretmocerus hayati TaxID=131215 RepID=A0ACC2NQP9_9HYME|nr:hypothetical protein QAD02_004460 [Eretmocerus hayati]